MTGVIAQNFAGIYMVEDTLTSYWPGYGGGYHNPGTFLEYRCEFWHLFARASLCACIKG